MTFLELISYLRSRDVTLWVEGDQLRYSAPSGVITPDLRAELEKHKHELLTFLRKTDSIKGFTRPPIRPIPRQAEHPASFSQWRLWFVDRLSPSPAYNTASAMRLTGPLNVAVLERCLNEVVRRHEALRTTFSQVGDRLLQVITPHSTTRLTISDLRGITETAEREAEAERLASREVKRLFDLARGPLFRSKLFLLSDEDHVLVLTIHHIVTDGWSWGVLFRELTALYEAFSTEKPSPLEELPIQYVDFAQWQREWLQGEVLEQQLSYWKKQLEGVPELLKLPTDRPRPAVQTFQGAYEPLLLPKALTAEIKALSRRLGVTPFMTLLAAFQVLLSRWTGQEDIVVGSPIAGRTRSELEGLIGLFLNTLVLRTDLSGNPSFRELLGRVREAALGAYDHQEVPFEQLMAELRLERSLSYTPLFQVMFVLQNTPEGTLELPGLTVSRFEMKSSTAMFDLFLSMHEGPGGLQGGLFYKTGLFDAATILRIVGYFRTLLEGVVANPDERISALPLLANVERQQLLVEWNATQRDYPKDRCVHELFEEQVERTPQATAVMFEEERLSYRELNRRANQLAHHLKALGVGPEVLVGICVERSLEMVVGLLGVLKAGGAYVPLDPSYPRERLAFMLEDAQVSVLLTQQKLVGGLPDIPALAKRDEGEELNKSIPTIQNPKSKIGNRTVVYLDTDWEAIARESKQNPASEMTAENLAYVIYTSGSTGKPKGVEITHRALVNFITSACAAFALQPSDRVLQFASISFDTAAEEIFPCLIRGAKLVLRTDSVLDSVSAFLQKCRDWGVTILDLPTLYWHELTERLSSEHLAIPEQLRLVIIGGEKAFPERLAQWQQCVDGSVQLINTYGPTEATVVATIWELNGSAQADGSLREVPIGRPIPNVQTYVLDKHLNPVPIGMPGELHIGGAGLARGYLNRPELTAEKFIPNPFSNKPGARLYKTGDLARYLPDGNIEFLGRIDSQVKIRGFRIELGETEAVLSQHPGVRETVVTAREDSPGHRRLVAYLVSNQQATPSLNELRSFLAEKLPDYMVPSAFMFLDALPLTPNGKVNRRALPTPDQTRPDLEKAFVAPRTPIEKALAGIWVEVLRFEQVGIYDNFFELGGHSLLATQVISRIRDTFHVELPLRTLFEKPTVAALAEGIELACEAEQRLQTPPMLPVLRNEDLPLSFAQQRLWFLDQLEPGSTVYNIPAAVRLTGLLNIAALEQSLNEILRRHEALRTTFVNADGIPAQVISSPEPFVIPVIDLHEFPKTERETKARRLTTGEARRPFDLTKGPLFRATLLRLGDQAHILLLTMHHIVSDGWSMGVFFRELSALYKSFSTGQPSPLPELPIQYTDFAIWQRNWLQGEVLEKQLSYWKNQLAGAAPTLDIPADRSRPAVQTFRGAGESLLLSQDLSEGLRALSRQSGVTLFMTLLAAFKTLLYRYTGQEDIVVGTPIAGRNRSEIEGLIGFFISTLVLRTELSGNPSFRELLGRVREVALGAYAHQDLPFEKLVEELQPERDLSHTPLFQVFFNMLNLGDGKLDLAGLTVEPFGSHEPTSKFDLTMYVDDRGKRLWFSLVYNTDLFEPATITRMLGHYQALLEGIVQNPDQLISSFSLLTEKERNQLSTRTNLIRATNPFIEFKREDIEQSISTRFEQQVKQYPDQIAVRTSNHQWTYSELNRTTNQIAQTILRSCGCGEERIGLLFEHDAPMIAAILGVLKAGKTYVPLDPDYPTERLAYILEDSQAGVILTNSNNLVFAKTLIDGTIQLINIDQIDATVPTTNPNVSVSPDTLAYILYTSGSTGRPKGVMQSHRNVLHHIRNYTNNLHLNVEDRLTLFSSYSHDAAIVDIFAALSNGATLCPWNVKEEGLHGLNEWLINEKATIFHSAPTLYQNFVDTLDQKVRFPRVRSVVLGGEAVFKNDFARFKQHFSQDCIFFNLYGSTESTINLLYVLNTQTEVTKNILPVGYPVQDIEVLLLNEAGEPAELYGEIGIRSPHVALGYWQKPELTKAAFLPDPDGGTKRIYRTGDMGRLLSDGSIGFVGRKDFQIKLRGFRIELGEIEAVLEQHPAARASVVIAREDSSGDKRLVAYVVADQQQPPTVSDLRSLLKARLPDYMVPSAFVMLDALPLTPNGKVDRRALPAPDQSRPDLEGAFVAPRTHVEQLLAGIWREVLKLEQVGIHDNFFDLGGHSLLATQVIARVINTFRVELPLRSFFEAPTVAGLAEVITQKQVANDRPEELARMLTELEALSDEEAQHLLAAERGKDDI